MNYRYDEPSGHDRIAAVDGGVPHPEDGNEAMEGQLTSGTRQFPLPGVQGKVPRAEVTAVSSH